MTLFSTPSTLSMGRWQEQVQKVRLNYQEFEMVWFAGEMIKSKLPNNVLGKIWKLSDVDRYVKNWKMFFNWYTHKSSERQFT